MATSKCPSCSSTSFELKEANIRYCNYVHYFIQCSSCGAVVGSIPFMNTQDLIERLAKKLNVNLYH
jgi:uncharacterized Zn finger protein